MRLRAEKGLSLTAFVAGIKSTSLASLTTLLWLFFGWLWLSKHNDEVID